MWLEKCGIIFAGNSIKISRNEAHKLYENLIKPKVDKLENAKNKSKDKRTSILNILENIELSIFDGIYVHYFDKPEITEKCIAKGTKDKDWT